MQQIRQITQMVWLGSRPPGAYWLGRSGLRAVRIRLDALALALALARQARPGERRSVPRRPWALEAGMVLVPRRLEGHGGLKSTLG
jgi:hypothetical protein